MKLEILVGQAFGTLIFMRFFESFENYFYQLYSTSYQHIYFSIRLHQTNSAATDNKYTLYNLCSCACVL